MIPREELERIAAVARNIAADCQSDAVALDSTPFTPKGVGESLGSMLAMIATLAKMVAALAEELA